MMLAGLAVIRPSRIAAFSAARIVARIRVRSDALSISPTQHVLPI